MSTQATKICKGLQADGNNAYNDDDERDKDAFYSIT